MNIFMPTKIPKYFRIMAIAVSTRGFGYAVLEGGDTLADVGVVAVTGKWTIKGLPKIEALLNRYFPEVVVMQDMEEQAARRSKRLRDVNQLVQVELALHKCKVALLSQRAVRREFFDEEPGTKDRLARLLAQRFPEDLCHRLPPSRKPWMSEDRRMDIFDAVALAVAFERKGKGTGE